MQGERSNVKHFQKFTFLLALSGLILASCAPAPTVTEDGLPILVIDEAHRQQTDALKMVEPYSIEPGKGFAIDLSQYTFQVPADVEFQPVDMIQISLGSEDMVYSLPVKTDQGLYKITKDTVTPMGENMLPFPDKLESGTLITVGVGFWDKGRGMFTAWYGHVSVADE
jgi:hypothetical protein